MILTAKNLNETEELAASFVDSLLKAPAEDGAVVVGLSGDLGAGKTAFTKGMAKALGISETVTSPTFVIEKIYKLKHKKFTHLIHIDAYRLEDPKELEVLGFTNLLREPKNIIVVEWVERVKKLMPQRIHQITMSFVDESIRKIHISHAKK